MDFAECMRDLVDDFFPGADKVVLVLDSLNTHTPLSLYEAFEPAKAKRILDRLEFHYTPKHGSQLDVAEMEIGVLIEQCLADRIPNEETFATQLLLGKRRAMTNGPPSTGNARRLMHAPNLNASIQSCQNWLEQVLVDRVMSYPLAS